MPRYHALDTAVKLYVWDPQQASNSSDPVSKDANTPNSNGHQRDLPTVPFSIFGGIPPSSKSAQTDPASGYDVDVVKEEYFEGQEGVDFLGHDMPFFLVNAGTDIFKSRRPFGKNLLSKAGVNSESYPHQNDGESTLPSFLSTLPANKIEVLEDYTHDVDADSSLSDLSDLSSSFFTPEIQSSPAPEIGGTISVGEPGASPPQSKREVELAKLESIKRGPRQFVSKPIRCPKPIKIGVDLSKKSFAPSIFNNLAQEVCINVFYNGEMTHSRVVRTAMKGDDKFLVFSGRQVDALLEVPWLVCPHSQSSYGYKSASTPVFEDRWNQINQLLLTESDEWGRYGERRSPMGEYLEELSKMAIPQSTKGLEGGAGGRAGIIDVVIALGRTISVAKVGQSLREPRRKLHEDICGKEKLLFRVPEELRPLRKAQIIADLNLEMSQNSGTTGNLDASTIEERSIVGDIPSKTPLRESNIEEYKAQESRAGRASRDAETTTLEFLEAKDVLRVQSQCPNDTATSTFVDQSDKSASIDSMSSSRDETGVSQILQNTSADLMPPPQFCRASLPSMTATPLSNLGQEMDGPKSTTVPMTPLRERPPPHPNMPKVIPQKRYKGSDSDPPPKRQKLDDHWGVLPFDTEMSTSLSTRSRRAASSPAGAVAEQINAQELIRATQRSRRPKNDPETSTEDGLASVQLTRPGIPRTQDFPTLSTPLSNVQTKNVSYTAGNSSSSLRKMRTSSSKLSDRPQNRRRGPRAVALIAGDSETIALPVFEGQLTSDNPFKLGVSGIIQHTTKNLTEETSFRRELSENTEMIRGESMEFGFDGAGDDRKRRSRIYAGSTQVNSSPCTGEDQGSKSSETMNEKHWPTREGVQIANAPESVVSKRITRIVLVSKDRKSPAGTNDKPNSRSFSSFNDETRIQRTHTEPSTPTSMNMDKKTSDWVSPNKFVTINHPSQKKRKAELEAQARRANAESPTKLEPTFKSTAARTRPIPSSKPSVSRKQSEPKYAVEPAAFEEELSIRHLESIPNSGFMKTTASRRSRSAKVTKSRKSALPKVSSVVTKSEPEETENTAGKPQRFKNTLGVGSRKLQGLLEPHQSSIGNDTSFSHSFTQARSAAARASRTPSGNPQRSQTQIQSDSGLTEEGDKKLTMTDTVSHEATVEGNIMVVKRRVSNAKEIKTSRHEQTTPTKPSPVITLHASTDTIEIEDTTDKSILIAKPSDTIVVETISESRRRSRSYSQTSQGMKQPSQGNSLLPTDEITELQTGMQEPAGTLSTSSRPRSSNAIVPKGTPISSTKSRRRRSTITSQPTLPTSTPVAVIKTPVTDLKGNAKMDAVDRPSFSPTSASLAPTSRMWKPNELCRGSVLTYAGGETGAGSENIYRSIRAEREGVFRASGILMGVRFVLGL